MLDTCHYTFVKTQRMYNTKSELYCKLQTLIMYQYWLNNRNKCTTSVCMSIITEIVCLCEVFFGGEGCGRRWCIWECYTLHSIFLKLLQSFQLKNTQWAKKSFQCMGWEHWIWARECSSRTYEVLHTRKQDWSQTYTEKLKLQKF